MAVSQAVHACSYMSYDRRQRVCTGTESTAVAETGSNPSNFHFQRSFLQGLPLRAPKNGENACVESATIVKYVCLFPSCDYAMWRL